MVRAKKQPRVLSGNGSVGFPNVNARFARRYRDIAYAIIGDHGGADQCSESRQLLIRRFAAAAALAEQLEARLARGADFPAPRHRHGCAIATIMKSLCLPYPFLTARGLSYEAS